jgi:hypothetical protein
MILTVDDIEAARDGLIGRGIDISEVQEMRSPGFDPPEGERSYFARRRSATPTGTVGAPGNHGPGSRTGSGRREMGDIGSLAELLHETSGRHGAFEAAAPPHDWWDWYAAYMDARQSGSSPDEASGAADRYMAEVKGVAVPG